MCSCWGGGIAHPTHWRQGQQWGLGERREQGRSKAPGAQPVAGCTGKGQAGTPGLSELAPGGPRHPSFHLPLPNRLPEPALPSPASCPLGARVPPPSNEDFPGGSRHLSSGLRDAAKPRHPQCSSARPSCAGLPAEPWAAPGPQRPSELVAAPSSPRCGHFAVEPCLRHQSWCWKPSEHPCLLIFHWLFHCLLETQSPPGRSAVPLCRRRPGTEHGCCCHSHVVTSAGGHLQSQPQSWAVLGTAWPGWQYRLGGQAEPQQQQQLWEQHPRNSSSSIWQGWSVLLQLLEGQPKSLQTFLWVLSHLDQA